MTRRNESKANVWLFKCRIKVSCEFKGYVYILTLYKLKVSHKQMPQLNANKRKWSLTILDEICKGVSRTFIFFDNKLLHNLDIVPCPKQQKDLQFYVFYFLFSYKECCGIFKNLKKNFKNLQKFIIPVHMVLVWKITFACFQSSAKEERCKSTSDDYGIAG